MISRKFNPKVCFKSVLIICAVTSIFIFGSCTSEESNGYPGHVYFPAGGATYEIRGDKEIGYMSIITDYGNGTEEPGFERNDTLFATYQWLTAKQKTGETILILEASPLKKGDTKKLTLHGIFYPNEYMEMVIFHK